MTHMCVSVSCGQPTRAKCRNSCDRRTTVTCAVHEVARATKLKTSVPKLMPVAWVSLLQPHGWHCTSAPARRSCTGRNPHTLQVPPVRPAVIAMACTHAAPCRCPQPSVAELLKSEAEAMGGPASTAPATCQTARRWSPASKRAVSQSFHRGGSTNGHRFPMAPGLVPACANASGSGGEAEGVRVNEARAANQHVVAGHGALGGQTRGI